MRSTGLIAILAALAFIVSPIRMASAAKITKIKIDNETNAILIDGEIVDGDDRKFIDLSLSSPQSVVVLSSSGGALVPALEIGRAIHLKGLPTWVPDDATCASACALIWIAGATRLKASTARIGFHASYVDEKGVATPAAVGNALVGRYLTQLELSQRAVVFATEMPPEKIGWLTEDVAEEIGITFRILDIDDPNERQKASAHRRLGGPNSSGARPGGKIDKDREDFIKAFGDTARSPKTILETFMRSGLDAKYYPIFENHIQTLFIDTDIQNYMYDKFVEIVGSYISSMTSDQARAIGQSITTKAQLDGLARLSDADISEFFNVMVYATEHSTPAQCHKIFSDKSDDSSLEMRIISGAGPEYLEKYYGILRNSVLAEARNYPPKPTPTDDERQRMEGTAANLFGAALLQVRDRDKLTKTLGDMDHASDADYCSAMHFILTTERDIAGKNGAELRRSFLLELGK